MKTKRYAKIATLALCLMLLVVCAVGISASAEETGATAVSVAGKNIVYQGELRIAYYVDAPDFDPETQTLKMNFWIAEKSGNADYVAAFEGEGDIVIKDGKSYYTIFSNGIAPIEMTKPLYCQPFIENSDGTIVTASEVTEYSVYTYAMNRFSQNPTEDQLTLYKALLDYGAAVQSIFPDDANVDIYGWADAYYDITKYVYVDGVLQENESLTRGTPYRPSEITLDKEGRHALGLANSTLNGALFRNITDIEGAPIDVQYALPGTYACKVNYTTGGFMQDFEGETDVNKLFVVDRNGGQSADMYYNSMIESVNAREAGKSFMLYETGDGNNTNYLVTGSYAKQAGWKIDLNDGTNIAPAVGVKYIIDFDFQIVNATSSTNDYQRLAYLGVNSTTGPWWVTPDQGGNAKNFISADLFIKGVDNSVCFDNNGNLYVTKDEWHDVRYEYVIVSENLANIRIYVDGVLLATKTTTTIAKAETFFLEMRNIATSQEYYFDNLWCYSYIESLASGQGKYYNETLKFSKTGATVFDFENKGDVTPNISYGADVFTIENGVASCVTTGTYNYFRIDSNNVTTKDNEKFIVEFDYMVKASGVTSDTRAQYIKLYSGSSYLGAISIYGSKNGFKVGSTSNPMLSFNEWYSIRIEITDDVGEYYVNNIKLGNFGFQDGKSDAGYAGKIGVWYENCNTTSGYSYVIDNLVVDNADTNNFDYYDKYQAGQLSENTVVADFNGTGAGVEDYLFAPNEVFTDVNKRPGDSDTDRKYTLIEDGAWVIGTQGISSATEKKEAYDRIELGFTDIAVGSKIVVEYDYKFVKIGDRVTNDGRSLSVGFGKTDKTAAQRTHEMWTNYKLYINPDNNSNGNGVFYFTAGEWNKLRIEVVTGESSYTVTYFVNGTQKYTETFNSSLTSVESFVFYLGNYAYQEHAIDNFVATVIAPASE